MSVVSLTNKKGLTSPLLTMFSSEMTEIKNHSVVSVIVYKSPSTSAMTSSIPSKQVVVRSKSNFEELKWHN
jgi:hypothetical protein